MIETIPGSLISFEQISDSLWTATIRRYEHLKPDQRGNYIYYKGKGATLEDAFEAAKIATSSTGI